MFACVFNIVDPSWSSDFLKPPMRHATRRNLFCKARCEKKKKEVLQDDPQDCSYQAMKEDSLKRRLPSEFYPHHDHSCYPEEQDVMTSFQNSSRVELL